MERKRHLNLFELNIKLFIGLEKMSGHNSRGVWNGFFLFTLWGHAYMLKAHDREEAKTPT